MTIFFITAALLVVLCIAWLLHGLFRKAGPDIDQEAINITLARERRQQLDKALADGALDEQGHAAEMHQLEQDLAADLRVHDETRQRGKRGNVAAAGLITIAIPIMAGALYLQLGNPSAIGAREAPESSNVGGQPPSLSELIPRLEARLAEAPEDVEGWRLLGRTHLSMNAFDKAQQALERALALDDRHAPTLAQLSESIAMQRGGELAGEPMDYLRRAIEIDPDHEHSQWLLAIGQQQAGEHAAALAGFDRLALKASDNPEALATIEQMRQRSVDALSAEQPLTEDKSSASTTSETESGDASRRSHEDGTDPEIVAEQGETDASVNPVVSEAGIDVQVRLDGQVMDTVQGDQLVFVYARASQGPPMPLAVSRLTVDQLPTNVRLDDSMAMMPELLLSGFPSVTIGARISSSGNPIAQSGDWFGEVTNVPTADTDTLTVVIDRRTP